VKTGLRRESREGEEERYYNGEESRAWPRRLGPDLAYAPPRIASFIEPGLG
jgi:hypothetical protein